MFWPQNVSFFLSLSISFVWSSFRSDKHLTNYALRACVSACTSSYKVFVIFARFKPKQKVPTNISKNFPKIKFDENRFSGFQFVSFIQTDGQAEGATRIYYQPSSLTGHPSLTKLIVWRKPQPLWYHVSGAACVRNTYKGLMLFA
jgi:hypothetical protein